AVSGIGKTPGWQRRIDAGGTITAKVRVVGAAGFEPTTLCPPDKCATRLRYAPTGRRHRQAGLLRQGPKYRRKEQKPKQPTLRDRWRQKVLQVFATCSIG